MFNKKKTLIRTPGRPISSVSFNTLRVARPTDCGPARMLAVRALAAARAAAHAELSDVSNTAARCTARCARLSPRRAWRTHAYRDSQVIFYGHDLPSEFLGRRR